MNTENWKWFRYDEIFEIKKGFFNKKPEESGFGTIPFIGATDSNNGVTSWYTIDEIDLTPKAENTENVPLNEKIFESPCITVSNNGSVGYAFYQTQPFTCSHDVNPLYLRDKKIILTPPLAFFLCGIIECEQFRWTYGRKWRPERMPNSLIKLPTTENGQPDWQWIEDYAKNTLLPQLPLKARQVWERRYNYQPLSAQKLELKVEEWKWFKATSIFDMYAGKYYATDEYEIGETPLVSSAETNNGIMKFTNLQAVFPGNCITIGKVGMSNFYQPYPFCASPDVTVLKPKLDLNQFQMLFIKTVLDLDKYRWCYGNQIRLNDSQTIKIKLPAVTNENGETVPDWQWMEDYIKGLPYSGAL